MHFTKKREKFSILRGSKILPITVQIGLQYLHNVSMCEISSFSSANIDHFWKCMNSRENDMARFYRYSSSLKWSEQMTFPMDQICRENPDNHSFLAITMIYILWRKLDQYYRYMSPDYSQLIAINSYFILDK